MVPHTIKMLFPISVNMILMISHRPAERPVS